MNRQCNNYLNYSVLQILFSVIAIHLFVGAPKGQFPGISPSENNQWIDLNFAKGFELFSFPFTDLRLNTRNINKG